MSGAGYQLCPPCFWVEKQVYHVENMVNLPPSVHLLNKHAWLGWNLETLAFHSEIWSFPMGAPSNISRPIYVKSMVTWGSGKLRFGFAHRVLSWAVQPPEKLHCEACLRRRTARARRANWARFHSAQIAAIAVVTLDCSTYCILVLIFSFLDNHRNLPI
jgi:hypothetical protein